MTAHDRLIRILSDGKVHSGSALAEALGVTRSAVWKQVHRLVALGIDVSVERGRGYRLYDALELLDRDAILAALEPEARMACEQLDIATVLTSTSAVLAEQGPAGPGRFRALFAEYQTAGRGRRGRRWLSPFGSGLCLSLSWSFADLPKDFPALSLAAGLAVRRALAATGSRGLALKWPNDVLVDGAKLAGILVDVDGDARGPLRVIVGTGVNLSVPSSLVREVTADGGMAPGGCNEAQSRDVRVGRNALAARLIGCLYQVMRDFAAQGFSPLADEWRAHDYLRGREVTVTGGARVVAGVARGIGPDGALLVEGADGIASVLAGDVTLRTDPCSC